MSLAAAPKTFIFSETFMLAEYYRLKVLIYSKLVSILSLCLLCWVFSARKYANLVLGCFKTQA